MMELYDVVRFEGDRPDIGLTRGMTGTIVEDYGNGDYEVEFCDDQGVTLVLTSLNAKELKPDGKN